MDSTDLLSWVSLTSVVNILKSPNQFLKKFLFSNHITRPTETLEIGIYEGARMAAPFVKVNAKAVRIPKLGEKFATVTAPNIRIAMDFEPSELMFNRRPGNVIMPSSGSEVSSAAEQYVARQVQRLADSITETEEWMCAMALRGAITYSVDGGDVFQITYPKASANKITLSDFWDTVDGVPSVDFFTAKSVVSEAVGLGLTDVILGSEAAHAFLQNADVHGKLDTRNVSIGAITFESQFREDGVIYLGRFSGLDVWSYPRQTNLNGVAVDLIRPKYAEFVHAGPAAENVIEYGAIPDLEALQGGLFQGERFAKSWMEKDPSVQTSLAHSRPLPVTRKPNSTVSMKVVSG